jgi:hypothetical protein
MRRLQLTRLAFRRDDAPSDRPEYFPGDSCPECDDGRIAIYCTKRTATTSTKYMRCEVGTDVAGCGFKPENKIVEILGVGTTT